MLRSAKHEICPANKSQSNNNGKFFLVKNIFFFLYILPYVREGILDRDARQAKTDRKLFWNEKSKRKIVKWIKDDRLK